MPSPRLHRVTSPYASAHTTQDIPNQEKTEVTRIIYSAFPPPELSRVRTGEIPLHRMYSMMVASTRGCFSAWAKMSSLKADDPSPFLTIEY